MVSLRGVAFRLFLPRNRLRGAFVSTHIPQLLTFPVPDMASMRGTAFHLSLPTNRSYCWTDVTSSSKQERVNTHVVPHSVVI